MLSILCDLDGVLADYLTGVAQFDIGDPSAASVIAASPTFWRELPPYLEAAEALALLQAAAAHLLFVTKRYGTHPQRQSQQWLQALGVEHPAVCIVPTDSAKGRIATLIQAHVLIDDRPQAFLALPPRCTGLLIDRPYNAGADLPRRVKRVGSVLEAARLIWPSA